MILIYDEDEKIAAQAGNTFYQKGIDNIFILTGGNSILLLLSVFTLLSPFLPSPPFPSLPFTSLSVRLPLPSPPSPPPPLSSLLPPPSLPLPLPPPPSPSLSLSPPSTPLFVSIFLILQKGLRQMYDEYPDLVVGVLPPKPGTSSGSRKGLSI